MVLFPPGGHRVLGTFRRRLAIVIVASRSCGVEAVALEPDEEDQHECQHGADWYDDS